MEWGTKEKKWGWKIQKSAIEQEMTTATHVWHLHMLFICI